MTIQDGIKQNLKETRQILQAPGAYFSSLKDTETTWIDLVLRALFYGLVGGILALLWGLPRLNAVGLLWGSAGSFWALIIWPLAAVGALFLAGLIIWIISSICGGSNDYFKSLRVSGALLAFIPICAFFSFTLRINIYLHTIIFTVISVYGLWILYHALRQYLQSQEKATKFMGIFLLIAVIAFSILTLFPKTLIRQKGAETTPQATLPAVEKIESEQPKASPEKEE
jgi:hypothetical protein